MTRSRVAALCELTIAITRGDDVRALCESLAQRSDLESWQVEESILQGIPYAGIPGAVEALGAWRDVVGAPTSHPELASESPDTDLTQLGAEIFRDVYGDQAERVRAELTRRHPTLERWIIEFAYGRVMGRRQLPHAEVEALGVASLMAQGRRTPLYSHVRGALRCGWTVNGLRDLVEELRGLVDESILQFVLEICG